MATKKITASPESALKVALAEYVKATYSVGIEEYEKANAGQPHPATMHLPAWAQGYTGDPRYPDEGLECLRLYERLRFDE